MDDVALRDAERQEEQHDASAVVEQALTNNRGAQSRRQRDLAQQIFDDDRVGGRKDRAQKGAPDQWNRHADQAESEPHAGAENHRRNDHARGGQDQDQPFPPVQLGDIDMQTAGEQQKGQKAIEEEVRQIGLAERLAEPPHDMKVQHVIAGDDEQRHDQRAEQHADRRRQPDPDVIDEADEDRKAKDHGKLIDWLHPTPPAPKIKQPRRRVAAAGAPHSAKFRRAFWQLLRGRGSALLALLQRR
jgi:hypothetical protein